MVCVVCVLFVCVVCVSAVCVRGSDGTVVSVVVGGNVDMNRNAFALA